MHTERGVWSAAQCAATLGAAEAAAASRDGWHTKRHTAHATTDLPATELSRPRYQALLESLHAVLLPRLGERYGFPPSRYRYQLRDLFFVKYEVKGDAQTALPLHQDGSILSFNVLLNPAQEFTGGGTFFERDQRTYAIEQGDALFHCGGLRHAAAPITAGRRMLLVGFVGVRELAHWPPATGGCGARAGGAAPAAEPEPGGADGDGARGDAGSGEQPS